jgi:hypothetical protein
MVTLPPDSWFPPQKIISALASQPETKPKNSFLSSLIPTAHAAYAGPKALGFVSAKMEGKTFSSSQDAIPRFEIDDSRATLIKGVDEVAKDLNSKKKVTLGDVLKHDELYRNYPDLKKIQLELLPADAVPGFKGGTVNAQVTPTDIIQLGKTSLGGGEPLRKNLMHEIQHIIQHKEGMTYQTSPKQPYMMKPGEVEAREVSDRINLTAAQRVRKPQK